jgi:hypothetical protein
MFLEHLEIMDHEMCGHDNQLEQQAYRVDGNNGIKQVIGLNNRKSIDYYYIKDERCLFIEFSDLARGKEDLAGENEVISSIENRLLRNKIKKLLKNNPRDEMVLKFKDSRTIFSKIPEHYEEVPTPFHDCGTKTFVIVHAPISNDLPEVEKAEITRFLRTLKTMISGCLEDEICNRVRLILLSEFASRW